MNSITDFLDLEDSHIIISDISISGMTKTITIETDPSPHFCPVCQNRMHSKGIKKRKIMHPILQDKYQLILLLKQRRWKCTNPLCSYTTNESFKFVKERRRTTNVTEMLIIDAFRDFSLPAASIAERFHTSDTYVMDVFDRYVRMARLPLTDIICIDEVKIDIDEKYKYGLVIQDFYTGDPIDFLQSRRAELTEPYFVAIPKEERAKVKYLITDMYKAYIAYVDKYFPNAVSVVDSFHVIQWMLNLIDNYIRQLIKKFKARDKDRYLEKHPYEDPRHVKIPLSDEVYLLQKYRWLILANEENITYHYDLRMDKHFHRLMNTYDYEEALYNVDQRLSTLRNLKEEYIRFNKRNEGNPDTARLELENIIRLYKDSGDSIFITFANTLTTYYDSIINSFVMVKKHGPGGMYDSRLSNGPIESINRVVKDMKRNSRGYRNFDHFRTRFLYAARSSPVIDATRSSTYRTYQDNDED
ncbi:MAG: ISL3 family transposase [Eubacteriales bacterium]|nr:ISL3 family transposase [Eubacteriales bacterium]